MTIEYFNVFVEYLTILKHKSNQEYERKVIFCVQTDLSKCLISVDSHMSLIDPNQILYEESRVSLLKTFELKKCFAQPTESNGQHKSIINETLDDLNCRVFKLDSNEKADGNFYLIKVVQKFQIHSLANTQFKCKLRADLKVEMYTLHTHQRSACFILALISKFLYFYNFLHVGNYYLLKSNQNFSDILSGKCGRSVPHSVLFVDESMSILDEFELLNYSLDLNSFNRHQEEPSNQVEYLKKLSGTLVEKKLKSNSTQIEFNSNLDLMAHFDLLLPNQEFKLVLRLDTGDEPNENHVTVYYDTRFSFYSLCILPGMDVTVYDLVKRADKVYKSSSVLNFDFIQQIDLLRPTSAPQANSSQEISTLKKKTLYDNLKSLDFIYTKCYLHLMSTTAENKSSQYYKLNLLFRNKAEEANSCMKVLAQIIKIYDLIVRIKCKQCQLLASSCSCEHNQAIATCGHNRKNFDSSLYNIELNISFLIDDHTSIMKLNYSSLSFDLRGQESNFFAPIADYLKLILRNYLNEIKMPCVPILLNAFDSVESEQAATVNMNKKIYEVIKECLVRNETTNPRNKFIKKAEEDNSDSFFETNVKLDIYKTLYDYLFNCVLNKYFIFYIDPDFTNEFSSANKQHNINAINSKLEFSLFDLNLVQNSNEQFKSIFYMKCYKFLPISILD